MESNRIKLGMVITMHSDLPKSVEFYKMLGLKLNFHMEKQWAEFSLNGVKFGMCPTTEKYDNVRTGLVLEIEEDLMAFYEEFKKKGVTFVNEPQVAPHGVMVGMKDPCGNVLDLYQATPEKVQQFAKDTIAKEAAEKAKSESETTEA